MKNPEVQSVVNQVLEKYPEVDTVILFGSANSSDWTSKSDIDLFFIDDSLGDSRIDLEINGIGVEIQTDSFSGAAESIKNEYGRLLNRNVSTMIATSETIRSKSAEKFAELKNSAQATLDSATTHDEEDVKMWKYSIWDYCDKARKDVARQDAIAFHFDSQYAIQNAVELVLAQGGTYFPQPKNLAAILQKISPEFAEQLRDFEAAIGAEEKLEILEKIKNLLTPQ